MYSVDANGAQVLIGYKDVFSDEMPNLIREIEKLNMHKAISIICELIRVRDAKMDPVVVLGMEFQLPFEVVLKKQMCGINPSSPEEMFSTSLLRKDVHIISPQMLLLLLKRIIQYGNHETMRETNYIITEDDYKKVIQLELIVSEEISCIHEEGLDINHFLYSTYHLNYKRNIAHEFLRMYYMMEKLSRDKNYFDDDVQHEYRDYYSAFTEKYKFTPTQYSALLFWELRIYYEDVNGLIFDKMWQKIDQIHKKSGVKELATKVINTLSQTINNYQEWSVESAGREWDFSKFFEFPFIMDLKGNYISVSDITLRNAFFEKLFWLIRDCYSQNDSRAMAFFGRLFEKYIQDLSYNAANNDYMYIAEFSYIRKNGEMKSSDAYIRNGANLLVTEAKGFSVLMDCMTKNERIEKNNNKLFVCPVLQADLCLTAVVDEKAEFKGIESAYIISVTMDNINAVPSYYNEIHTSIEKRKQCHKTKYFFNFNIEEYEMLMYLVEQNYEIFGVLRDYYENSKLKPFQNFLLEKFPNISMTSFMEKYYKEASNGMKEMYFGE